MLANMSKWPVWSTIMWMAVALSVSACAHTAQAPQTENKIAATQMKYTLLNINSGLRCSGTVSDAQSTEACKFPQSANNSPNAMEFSIEGSDYRSICAENTTGVRMFCLLGANYSGSTKTYRTYFDEDYMRDGLSYGYGKATDIFYGHVARFTNKEGYISLVFYADFQRGGAVLCRMELMRGERQSICPRVGQRAQSVAVSGFYSGPQGKYRLCFRSALDESNRCYQSENPSVGLGVLNIFNLNSKISLSPVSVTSKGGDITGRLYSVDYLAY